MGAVLPDPPFHPLARSILGSVQAHAGVEILQSFCSPILLQKSQVRALTSSMPSRGQVDTYRLALQTHGTLPSCQGWIDAQPHNRCSCLFPRRTAGTSPCQRPCRTPFAEPLGQRCLGRHEKGGGENAAEARQYSFQKQSCLLSQGLPKRGKVEPATGRKPRNPV